MEEALQEEDLRCPICFEDYQGFDEDFKPKLLNCLHTFCFKCIAATIQTDRKIECAMCRKIHVLDSPRDAWDNVFIISLLRKKQELFDEDLARSLFQSELEVLSDFDVGQAYGFHSTVTQPTSEKSCASLYDISQASSQTSTVTPTTSEENYAPLYDISQASSQTSTVTQPTSKENYDPLYDIGQASCSDTSITQLTNEVNYFLLANLGKRCHSKPRKSKTEKLEDDLRKKLQEIECANDCEDSVEMKNRQINKSRKSEPTETYLALENLPLHRSDSEYIEVKYSLSDFGEIVVIDDDILNSARPRSEYIRFSSKKAATRAGRRVLGERWHGRRIKPRLLKELPDVNELYSDSDADYESDCKCKGSSSDLANRRRINFKRSRAERKENKE